MDQPDKLVFAQHLFGVQKGESIAEVHENFIANQSVQIQHVFNYVKTTQQFNELKICGNILGIDIEEARMVGFDGKTSIIQIKDQNNIHIIDILELTKQLDIKTISQRLELIFTNPAIIKVFYAAQDDCLRLSRDFNIKTQNIFDIKIIADKLYSGQNKSLIVLWQEYCDYNITKAYKQSMQQSDWSQRPLSSEQLLYAAHDCLYLPYLRHKLLLQLIEKVNLDEQIILTQKMMKITDKEYKKPISSKRSFVKTATEELTYLIQEAQDCEQMNSTYKQLMISQNAKAIVKYISYELFNLRQQYALHNDVYPDSVEEDERIVLKAIFLFEKIGLKKLCNFQQFYQDTSDYQNSQYLITSEQIQQCLDLDWDVVSTKFCRGLGFSLMNDINMVKSAITQIYDIENKDETHLQKVNQKFEKKKIRTQEFTEKYTRQKPAYGDCKIVTKDDFFLCNCDIKKVNWYLKQGLADQICDDPVTIKLKFEPSGFKEEGKDTKQFITIERINQCVVCGSDQNLMKFHIVPVLYKKHILGKRSYDVVCLCLTCHQKASSINDKVKKQLEVQFNIKSIDINPSTNLAIRVQKFTKDAQNFQKKSSTYPEAVQNKFKQQLLAEFKSLSENQQFYQIAEPILTQIQTCQESGEPIINNDFFAQVVELKKFQKQLELISESSDSGKLIVDQLKSEQDISDFLVYWRDSFLSQMKPEYLTEAWAVDHKFQRTFGEKSKFYVQEKQQEEQQKIID